MTDPWGNPHGFFQPNGHPNQPQSQNGFHPAYPGLYHSPSWPAPKFSSPGTPFPSYTTSAPPAFYNHVAQGSRLYHQPDPHLGHSATVGHAPHNHSNLSHSATVGHAPHNHPNLSHSATVGHAPYHNPLAPEQQHLSRNGAATPSTCLPTGKLCITVFKARNIKGDEWRTLGKADPYAVIKVGGKNLGVEAKTTIREDAGSNPEWNQAFWFYVKKVHSEYNELNITLYDDNWMRKDVVLGQLRIVNLGQYVWENRNRVLENWYPVFLDGKPKGEILLAFDMIPMSAEEILGACTTVVASSVPRAKTDPGKKYTISKAGNVVQVVLQGMALVVAFGI